MATTVYGGVEFELDEDGFIQEPEKWSKEVAEGIAKAVGSYPLTDDHWKVINYLREYYEEFETAPPVRTMLKETGHDLKYIYQLFPAGPGRGACKIAGLSKPTGCV